MSDLKELGISSEKELEIKGELLKNANKIMEDQAEQITKLEEIAKEVAKGAFRSNTYGGQSLHTCLYCGDEGDSHKDSCITLKARALFNKQQN